MAWPRQSPVSRFFCPDGAFQTPSEQLSSNWNVRILGILACVLAATPSLPTHATPAEQGEKVRPARVSSRSQVFNLAFCENKALSVELPTRYEVVRWPRRDFDLFSITEAGQSGSSAELVVYIGHAPNEKHPEGAIRAEGRVAGQRVEWYSWSEPVRDKTVCLAEALVDLFPVAVKHPVLTLGKPPAPPPAPPPPPPFICEEGISVHLLARGPSREAVTGAVALAASIKKQ